MSRKFSIALVGRPNVGKSELFNRLTGMRKSIVEDREGVTRDIIIQDVEIFGKKLSLIDTGGIDSQGGIAFSEEIKRQSMKAIDLADAIIFVVDGRVGPLLQDEEVAHLLLKKQKPVVLAVNKIDSFESRYLIDAFHSLGVGDPIPVSAVHGRGAAEVIEAVCETYFEPEEDNRLIPKVAIIGRPNVGKSTLINALLGEERCIVSSVAGTTRDAIDQECSGVCFIDTAGIRKKNKEPDTLEKFARVRTEKAIERSDICLMVLDVNEGLTVHDKEILTLIEEKKKGCILFLNKWDVIDNIRMEHAILALKERNAFLRNIPILVGSAKSGRNLNKIYDGIHEVMENMHRRVTTGELNNFLQRAVQENHPPAIQGKRLRIYYLTQSSIHPPQFVLFVNDAELFSDTYKKYLINKFVQAYNFMGCPLQFKIKAKKRKASEALV